MFLHVKMPVLCTLCLLMISGFSPEARADSSLLRSGDYVVLYVYNAPELCGEFKVHANGAVRLPLVGEVPVTGLSAEELHEALQIRIGEYHADPRITITPMYSVYVLGKVSRPGVITITDPEPVIEIVTKAGGFATESSGSITIVRQGERIRLSKKDVLESASSVFPVMPGDLVIADAKFFSLRTYSVLLSTFSALTVARYYITR